MDQIKIGKFIAQCRKEKRMTQQQLAEKLGITDRAISKWENGRGLPDSSIMLDLCNELEITVNELLSGEVLEMNSYNEKLEKNLIDMVKQKEESDKRLLTMEIVIGVLSCLLLVILISVTYLVKMPKWLEILLIAFGMISFMIAMSFGIKIEQTAGYYECGKCHHKYVPSYSSVFWAMHFGRTRYMKCPQCGKRSWNRKVISK